MNLESAKTISLKYGCNPHQIPAQLILPVPSPLEILNSKPEPITDSEREQWLSSFEGICLSSDAYIPFRDNIDRADRSKVKYIAQPGSSLRDEEVIQAVDEYGMTMAFTGIRCFLH